MGIPASQNPDTPEGLEQRLSVGIQRIQAEPPHSSKLEPRNPMGPRRIPTELLCLSYEEGSIGWEALQNSEPRHSPGKAVPSYYTMIECFASGISKMWCVCIDFHR
jgi:hypothetical protein